MTIQKTAAVNVLIYASPATKAKRLLTITQVEHQTIEVLNGNTPVPSGTKIDPGTKLTVRVTADAHYDTGTIQVTGSELDPTDNSFIVGTQDIVVTVTASSLRTRIVNITQTEHQVIHVFQKDTEIASGTAIAEGTELTVSVTADKGYTAGAVSVTGAALNVTTYTFTVGDTDITVAAAAPTLISVPITIIQVPHQNLTVRANNKDVASGSLLPYGTTIYITVTPDEGYTAGEIQLTGTELSGSRAVIQDQPVTVTIADAQQQLFTVTIQQIPHQTITVLKGTDPVPSGTNVAYGTSLTATVTPDEGYTAGTIQLTGAVLDMTTNTFIVRQDVVVTASASVLRECAVFFDQTQHQTIQVTVDGTVYTTDHTFPYGTAYSITIFPDAWFTAGSLLVDGQKQTTPYTGTLTKDIRLGAEPANVIREYELTVGLAAQWGNDGSYVPTEKLGYQDWGDYHFGTISPANILDAFDVKHNGTDSEINFISGASVAGLFDVFSCELTEKETGAKHVICQNVPNSEFNASGDLKNNAQFNSQHELIERLIGKEVILRLRTQGRADAKATLHIEQSDHQTITVTANGKSYTSDIELPYGTLWTAAITADEGYAPGKLSKTSGTLVVDDTVSATAASRTQVQVTFVQTEHQTIQAVQDGVTYTKDFTTDATKDITFTVIPEMWWEAGALILNRDTQDASQKTVRLTEDTTVTAAAVTKKTHYVLQAGIQRSDVWNSDTFIGMNSSGVKETWFGSIEPDYVLDNITIQDAGKSSHIWFYGWESVTGLFNYFTMILTDPDGNKYALIVNAPNSAFDKNGDINDNAEFTGHLELFRSLIGKVCTIDLYITDTPYTDATVHITINQSANQKIHVYTGSERTDHTESFDCPVGTSYEIKNIPEIWHNAGDLKFEYVSGAVNLPLTGSFQKDTTISAGEATVRTDYDVKVVMATMPKNSLGFGASCTYIWGNTDGNSKYGSFDPLYVIDIINIWPADNTFTKFNSDIAFWGKTPVTGLFKTFSATLTEANGTKHTLITAAPNSAFGTTVEAGMGDIVNYPEMATMDNYALFGSLLGQEVTIHIHIDV